jgi:hypothetical protein
MTRLHYRAAVHRKFRQADNRNPPDRTGMPPEHGTPTSFASHARARPLSDRIKVYRRDSETRGHNTGDLRRAGKR